MSFENRLDVIPNFLRAQSLTGLRSLMSKNNLRLKAHVQYFNIQFVKGGVDDPQNRGYWIAFYYESELVELREKVTGL